jgi:drug/metabolite transporter (DMT)-like permease
MLNKDPVIREVETAIIVACVMFAAVLGIMIAGFWPFDPHWSQWAIGGVSGVVGLGCGVWLDAHGYHPEA